MDVSKTFESVLNCVRNSGLNFVMTRTPFSATVSLKRSLVKHKVDTIEQNASVNKDYTEFDNQVEILEKKLNEAELERSRVEELYKQEKIKMKQAAENESQFRIELLRIKSEKHNLSSTVKYLEVKCDNLEDGIKCIQVDEKGLVAQLKTVAAKNEELIKDKDCSELMIENLISKVEDFKDQLKHSNICSFCEQSFQNNSDLTVHMQNQHSISQGTQYHEIATNQQVDQKPNSEECPVKTFNVYKCFYCHRTIHSEDQLESHMKECHTVCGICDAQCSDESDLQLHKSEYHTWIIPQYLCSQCPTNFRRKESLQAHRKYSHGI